MKFYYIFGDVVDNEIEAVRLCKDQIYHHCWTNIDTPVLRNESEKRGLPKNGQRKTLLKNIIEYEVGLNIDTLQKLLDYITSFGVPRYSGMGGMGCECESPLCLEIEVNEDGTKSVKEWF